MLCSAQHKCFGPLQWQKWGYDENSRICFHSATSFAMAMTTFTGQNIEPVKLKELKKVLNLE